MCEWKTIISILIKGGLHVLFFKLSTIFDKTLALCLPPGGQAEIGTP